MKQVLWFATLGLSGFVQGETAWAGTCSLCREALNTAGGANLIRGYYWSILLIVTVPLVMMSVIYRFASKSYGEKK